MTEPTLYLLDTNAAIAFTKRDDLLLKVLVSADELFVSVIVLGELYFGAGHSSRPRENLENIQNLVEAMTILECNHETARQFGRINTLLRKKGRPIQSNDVWIAATAIQFDLTLLTRDTDFNAIDGLNLKSW